MLFSSAIFLLLFFPIVLIIYYNPVWKSRKFRNIFLLLVSLFFYAWGEPVFVFFMLFSIVVSCFLGIKIAEARNSKIKQYLLIGGTCYHIGILFIFKYLTFVCKEVGLLFSEKSTVEIALPIGISFFTFQMMSYLFDVYYEKAPVQRNVLYLALYVSLFPQLIAGPIVRYQTVAEEIVDRHENIEDFECGIKRFVIGLAKKVMVADFLGEFADRIFAASNSTNLVALTAWIGAIAYSLQIYIDFSAYSDMAIGLGNCFGFHFRENFNYPYIANSITDFWKRWHISLTDWFRDYVYIPLGGNRVSRERNIFNICVVWCLTGIWHGANWTFLLWGVIYCVFQIMEKHVYSVEKWPKVFRHVYTMAIVIFCWVIFKSDSISAAFSFIASMFGMTGFVDEKAILYLKSSGITIVIGIIVSLPIGKMLKEKFESKMMELITYSALAVFLIFTIMISISGGYSPFIYFNF